MFSCLRAFERCPSKGLTFTNGTQDSSGSDQIFVDKRSKFETNKITCDCVKGFKKQANQCVQIPNSLLVSVSMKLNKNLEDNRITMADKLTKVISEIFDKQNTEQIESKCFSTDPKQDNIECKTSFLFENFGDSKFDNEFLANITRKKSLNIGANLKGFIISSPSSILHDSNDGEELVIYEKDSLKIEILNVS